MRKANCPEAGEKGQGSYLSTGSIIWRPAMWKYDHFMRAKGQGHMRNGVLAPGSSKQGGLSICSGLASVARVTLRCSRRMHAQPKAPRWQGTAGRHRGQIESPAAILEQHGSRNPPSQRAVPSNATNAWRSNAPRPHAGDGPRDPTTGLSNLWILKFVVWRMSGVDGLLHYVIRTILS